MIPLLKSLKAHGLDIDNYNDSASKCYLDYIHLCTLGK